MAKGILIAAMDFSNVAEDEFNDWYDTEHVPERLAVPGFINAHRWIGSDNPKLSVATYDLDEVGVLHSPPYQAVGGANGSPWTKRVTGRVKHVIRLEGDQILPGDGLAPRGAAALLVISMNPVPEAEAEFNAWYNTIYIPNYEKVPGVIRGRRYRAVVGTPTYMTLYEFEHPQVSESAAWQAQRDIAPETHRIRPHMRHAPGSPGVWVKTFEL